MLWIPETPLISLDTETTDKDPEQARVIDIAAAYVTPGEMLDLRQTYVNPGVPIPAESTAVHGLTDEFIQAEGKRVSDEQGPRVLKTLAAIYGATWDDSQAHGASYDAVVTARVLWRMAGWCALPRPQLLAKQTCLSAAWKKVRPEDAGWFEAVAAMSPMQLHEAQIGWAAEQADGLATHWRGQVAEMRESAGRDDPSGDEGLDADERRTVLLQAADELEAKADGVRTEWPIAPLVVTA